MATFSKGTGQTWVAPSNASSITLDCAGAQGGALGNGSATGGKGGRSQGTFAVTGGTTYYISVGGSDGTNGGGSGAFGSGTGSKTGGNGGGMTYFSAYSTFAGGTPIIIAGGGGGNGDYAGGAGGGTSGSNGSSSGAGGRDGAYGYGGTTSGGAAGAAGTGATGGSSGSSGQGGGGGSALGSGGTADGGGGGGGGYFGGGSGGSAGYNSGAGSSAGGGGGSSYLDASLSVSSTTSNYQSGDGYLTLSVNIIQPPFALTGMGVMSLVKSTIYPITFIISNSATVVLSFGRIFIKVFSLTVSGIATITKTLNLIWNDIVKSVASSWSTLSKDTETWTDGTKSSQSTWTKQNKNQP